MNLENISIVVRLEDSSRALNMQMSVLMKEREKAIETRTNWYRKKTDPCLCSLLNAVLWNRLTVSGIEGKEP